MGGFPSPRRIWVEIEAVSWVQHLVKNQAPCSSLFFYILPTQPFCNVGSWTILEQIDACVSSQNRIR